MIRTIFVAMGVIAFVWAMWFISYLDGKRKRKRLIHTKFGTLPKARDWEENVRNYDDVVTDGSGVDDVTWNDLSMNEVFSRINQCDTSVGEEILYHKLRKNKMSPEERRIFERRVRAFSENAEEREAVEECLFDIGKGSASYFIPAYMDAIDEYRLRFPWVYRVLQVILLCALILFLILRNDVAGMMFLGVCIVNLGIYFFIKMGRAVELSMVGTAVSLIENAKKIARRREIDNLFPELKQALSGLKGVMRGARFLSIQKDGRQGGDALEVFLDYVMGITLWQVTTYNKVMRRLSENVSAYLAVYECIGELDASVCTASFRKSLPWYCQPEYVTEKKIRMEKIYHPLIKEPVPNSLDLEKSCLITGSNASGKSTFIKAMAVNAILAQSLNTCAAACFILPQSEVITSMAVKDDLVAGESYFIREIRYLKRILDSLNEGKMTLCAIDEILRGTNTWERIRASRAILDYLADKNCIALVATHDKELTELMGDAYANYHFSEEIGTEDITFSYKLLPGPATSHNAVKLLEFAGFPKEIITAAGE